MGWATIVGGGEDGRYTISFDIGTAARAGRVAAVTAQLAELAPKLVDAQAAYDAAAAAVDDARVDLAAAVDAYVAATQASSNPADWTPALLAHDQQLKLCFALQARLFPLRLRLDDLKMAKAQREKELARWNALTLEETRLAWCVDLTEDASGAVATIEIPGESELMLVAPGGRAWTPADGVLASRALLNPPQAYFNAAILPGWQKFKPTYRWGTITALDVDNDTADVTLGAAVSSAQGLGVNQADTLSGIPVVYMTCNAAAFEVGDVVVVQFVGQDWAAPKVIGFLTDPKPCTLIAVSYVPSVYLAASPEGGFYSPLPIVGDAAQSVHLHRDATAVSAAAPVLGTAWYQWSDGETALARHDLDIEMDVPPTPTFLRRAYYVVFPMVMILSTDLAVTTLDGGNVYHYVFTYDGFTGYGGLSHVSGALAFDQVIGPLGGPYVGVDWASNAPQYVVSWTILGTLFTLRYVYDGLYAGQPSYRLAEQSVYYV